MFLDGSPIDKEGEDPSPEVSYVHEAHSPASTDLEWTLINQFLSPMSGANFGFWHHLDTPETSAVTKACWEFTLWDITWSLISNAKEWQVSRNMIALPLMCILSVNREMAISGSLRSLIGGLCFERRTWPIRNIVGELLKLTLAPRKLVIDINMWLTSHPDLEFVVKRATSSKDVTAPRAFCSGLTDKVGLLSDGGGSVALCVMSALTNKVMDEDPAFMQPGDLKVSRRLVASWMSPEKTYVSYHY